ETTAPALSARLWYGMPAYAKDGKVLCFFQSAQKFKTRYATLGFSDKANLDDGAMWPTSFALTDLNAADEARIAELVKRAVSSPLRDAYGAIAAATFRLTTSIVCATASLGLNSTTSVPLVTTGTCPGGA